MSRTERVYNMWAKNQLHPFNTYMQTSEKWWKQWGYGKSSCMKCKDDFVFVRIHNKRKKILLKKHKYEMIS